MSTKTTYIDASRKRAVREFLFSFFNEDSIVGLAGPDINEYIRWCKEKKITNIELWENDGAVMLNQLSKLKDDLSASYKFGDIIDAESKKDCVYDLDYCKTIRTMYDHIRKFKTEKFVMTFATRKVGNLKTIDLFFKGRKEKVEQMIEKDSPIHHYVIKTVFGKYMVCPYFDTTPMISIAKI